MMSDILFVLNIFTKLILCLIGQKKNFNLNQARQRNRFFLFFQQVHLLGVAYGYDLCRRELKKTQ